MGNKRIILAVTNDLLTDQRVHRSCCALSEAGYSITLIGRHLPNSLPLSRPYRTHRMHLLFRRKAWFYAEYNLRLFLRLLFTPADLFYANDTDTLLAITLAARLRGKKVFFDAHEMFPEVPELTHRPRIKKAWQRIEQHTLPHVNAAIAVCQPVAHYYQRYGLTPLVVRNIPQRHTPTTAPLPFSLPAHKQLILYQGAINLGRCVDLAIHAMQHLPHCHLLIAGDGDEALSLQRYAASLPYADRITFLGRLNPHTLAQLTQQAHLGLCLLENKGLNYYYSLPNRIGDYAWAEIPVLATNFPEIRRVVTQFQIGTLVDEPQQYNSQILANLIQQTLTTWQALTPEERHRRFSQAQAHMDWNQEKQILTTAIHHLLD